MAQSEKYGGDELPNPDSVLEAVLADFEKYRHIDRDKVCAALRTARNIKPNLPEPGA